MYKMIAIDLDGTLLNDEKEISKEDILWVRKAYKEKGVIPVIATGRTLTSAKHFADMLGMDVVEYIIAQNGAIIKDITKNEYIRFKLLDNETIEKSINILKLNNLEIHVSTEDYIILDQEKSANEIEIYNKLGDKIKVVKDLVSYNFNDENITIMVGVGTKENLSKATEELKKNIEDILIIPISKFMAKNGEYVYESYYIEFNAGGITKGNGITSLSEYLNIKSEELIVIGDGQNDSSMFELDGFKIAMENGVETLKNKADYITGTNNENGVAKAIKKYIFNL